MGSWNSKNSFRTNLTTKQDFPTAESPSKTSLKWHILLELIWTFPRSWSDYSQRINCRLLKKKGICRANNRFSAQQIYENSTDLPTIELSLSTSAMKSSTSSLLLNSAWNNICWAYAHSIECAFKRFVKTPKFYLFHFLSISVTLKSGFQVLTDPGSDVLCSAYVQVFTESIIEAEKETNNDKNNWNPRIIFFPLISNYNLVDFTCKCW